EQVALVHEGELEPEKLRVTLRLVVEREGGAEVVARQDQRDLDFVAALLGARDDVAQPLDRVRVDFRVERQKEVLHQQVVAGRIAVRLGRRRKAQRNGGDDERNAPSQ